jgi:hypothetical protein
VYIFDGTAFINTLGKYVRHHGDYASVSNLDWIADDRREIREEQQHRARDRRRRRTV